jgi:hypothetical protein
VAFVLLGPELGARVQLGAGILALAMGIAINVAASMPAARRWPAPLQGALRRTALSGGPVFCAAGAALALEAAGDVGRLASGLAGAALGATATVGALRLQRSADPAPRWAAWSTGGFAATVTVVVILGIVLPKFRGVSGKAVDYPMRNALDSLARYEEHAHDSTHRYLSQREIAGRGFPLVAPEFTLAVESADTNGIYLSATARNSARKCGYVVGWVKDTLPEWDRMPPTLFPRCWTPER